MARKKRRTTRTKARRTKSRSVSTMGERRPARRGGKRRARRTKGLSDIFTKEGAKSGLKSTALGFGMGIGAGVIDSVAGDNELIKAGATLIPAFAFGAMGWHNMGAGLAGGYGALLEKRLETTFGLSDDFDDANYANEDAMSEYPDGLTEDNQPLLLADDGYYYLAEDFYKSNDGDLVLSDNASPYNASLAIASY